MDGPKHPAAGGRVATIHHEDNTNDGMQCHYHPYRSNPGGICAFCLQEKLGKLVSSSFPLPHRDSTTSNSSSCSSPPPFRSDVENSRPTSTKPNGVLFLLSKKKKPHVESINQSNQVFNRSASTPRRTGFWSYFYLSSNSKSMKRENRIIESVNVLKTREKIQIQEQEDEFNLNTFDRKVSRSRSVGCGSRSFSGDFFDRISTGFGDCTLRRVESQREGKPKMVLNKERVRCGGIFGGFAIITSSSSSSSYFDHSGKSSSSSSSLVHGRSKSWGWAFASPMRAFNTNKLKRDGNGGNKTNPPNLNAIPSLLAHS